MTGNQDDKFHPKTDPVGDMPLISLALLSWNRANQLAVTLENITRLRYPSLEIIVVDNGSQDGSPDLVRNKFSGVKLIQLDHNIGCVARNHAALQARGRYVVMLDDDSWPMPGSLEKMVRIFKKEPSLGALGFRSRLPDGKEESIGMHCVFQGCGAGFRRDALLKVGGYPSGYGFYVEEYDLSFRLLAAGYEVAWGRDLWVEHRRSPVNRNLGGIIHRLVRNNLWLWPSLLPPNQVWPQLIITLTRHGMVARKEGVIPDYLRGLLAGLARLPLAISAKPKLKNATIERILGESLIRRGLLWAIQASTSPKIALLIYNRETKLFIKWARNLGIEVVGLYDDLLCRYRAKAWGLPVFPMSQVASCSCKTAVIASTSPGAAANARLLAKRLKPDLEVVDLIPWLHGD